MTTKRLCQLNLYGMVWNISNHSFVSYVTFFNFHHVSFRISLVKQWQRAFMRF
uniref:Uncharacterized protein n=1 Tax=Setaria italica TaxID=4555 RepID=K3ZKZ0_SETIT